MASDKSPCPCGSKSTLAECCLPVIQGKREARTAEELLRARYTAFTRGDVGFILDSHHSRTRGEVKRDEIEEWSKSSEWLGLEIHQKEAGEASDEQGRIVFHAKYRVKTPEGPKDQDHWEQAVFEKDGGRWRFLDAFGIKQGTYRRESPKIGRNDPCSCGSGKKFKKCHGAGAA